MATQALEDIRVLDLTHHVAGPYCTKLLADYGADVIKIEKPGEGDIARRLGPFPNDEPDSERSGLFLHLNTSKRGITLNLRNQQGKAIFRELVKGADILVENFAPRVMPSLGLDYVTLREINPRLVMVSISNFGQTGPYRDFKASEMVVYAMGGDMHSRGLPELSPVQFTRHVVLYQAGHIAAVATLGAYFGTTTNGIGQHVDVSMMETLSGGTDMRSATLLGYQYTGEVLPRMVGMGGGGSPRGVTPCQDGYAFVSGGGRNWPKVVQALGNPPELKDPKWLAPTAQGDPQLQAEFDAIFIPWMMSHSKLEVVQAGQDAKMNWLPFNTVADLFTDPHFQAREYWTELEHPRAGTHTYSGRPFIMSRTPWRLRRPAPLLGQHNAEVLGDLGYSPEDLVRLRGMGVI